MKRSLTALLDRDVDLQLLDPQSWSILALTKVCKRRIYLETLDTAAGPDAHLLYNQQ